LLEISNCKLVRNLLDFCRSYTQKYYNFPNAISRKQKKADTEYLIDQQRFEV